MVTSALKDAPSALSPLAARLTKLGSALGTGVGLVGLAVLAGWLLDVPLLRTATPDGVPMKAITALALVLAGVALGTGTVKR
jgi:hypothetical protein